MKKPLGIRLEDSLWRHVKNKPNHSRYVEGLIKQDIQMEHTKPIVEAVKQELMQNEGFFFELSQRLGTKRLDVVSPTGGVGKSESQVFVPRPPDPHSGYPCCQKTSPCKHWKFNDVEQYWVNELTGEIKSD